MLSNEEFTCAIGSARKSFWNRVHLKNFTRVSVMPLFPCLIYPCRILLIRPSSLGSKIHLRHNELTMDWLKMNSLHKSERFCSFLVMFGLLTSVIWQKPDMFLSLLCSCLKVVVVSRTKPGITSCEVTMLLKVCSGVSIFVYD